MADLAPLVVEIDEAYVVPLCLFLHSLRRGHMAQSDPLSVIVVHSGLERWSWAKVQRHAAAVAVEDRWVALPRDVPTTRETRLSPSVYLRLAMLDALEDLERFVHLDVDVMVVSSLAELRRTSPAPDPIAAVVDGWVPELRFGDVLPGWQGLGLSPRMEYFNAGVMVVESAEVKRCGLFAEALRFARERPQCIAWGEQDALNAVAGGRWLRLPYKWNTLQSSVSRWASQHSTGRPLFPYSELVSAEECASIVHFAGPRKPWQPAYPPGALKARFEPILRAYQAVEDSRVAGRGAGHG